MDSKFNAGDVVLVRDDKWDTWRVDVFDVELPYPTPYPYGCRCGVFKYCIPFEGNQHQCYTTSSSPEVLEELRCNHDLVRQGVVPGAPVLVRDSDVDVWVLNVFGRYRRETPLAHAYYACLAGAWSQCIPYAGNEHLYGTKDRPTKFVVDGDRVLYRESSLSPWGTATFSTELMQECVARNGTFEGYMAPYDPGSVGLDISPMYEFDRGQVVSLKERYLAHPAEVVKDTHEPEPAPQQLEPFQRVLVRDSDHKYWRAAFFSHKAGEMYVTLGGLAWDYCLDYGSHKHLCNTIIDPSGE